jgi:uncharacterized phage protein gp47/JayE
VFRFADYIQKQKFALTADLENLILHGEELGITLKPAAPAAGNIDISVASSSTMAQTGVFTRADGVQYVVTSGGAITGAGTLTVPVVALTDGANTNALAGAPLAITAGFTGDGGATAVVSSGGIVAGADVEDIESFRARILFRKRNPPHGGAPADYVMWGGEVSGVTFALDRPTVYVERLWSGAGTVRVFPLMYGLYANGIPQAADVRRVSDYIASVAPAGAAVTVAAPVAVPVDIVISGITSDMQEAVKTELASTFQRRSRVAGNDQNVGGMPYLAYPTSFSRSWIWQAVSNASGAEPDVVVSPPADVALSAGQMATLGNVAFT